MSSIIFGAFVGLVVLAVVGTRRGFLVSAAIAKSLEHPVDVDPPDLLPNIIERLGRYVEG